MKTRMAKLTTAALAALMMASATVPVHAQIFGLGDDDEEVFDAQGNVVWDRKKLERLDRNVRKLQSAIARLEGKNAPTILIEPDPEVVALQATVDTLARKTDDQATAIQRMTGQIEELQFQNRQLTTQLNASNARLEQLTARLDAVDAHLREIDSVLAPPPPPPSSLGSPDKDFEQAYALLTTDKLDDAERAFSAFTQTWPESAQVGEAWYRLAQIRTMKGDTPGAVTAYATALKGWPKTAWAPDATVRLAEALTTTNRPSQACEALGYFDRLYARSATADAKNLAKTLKTRNRC